MEKSQSSERPPVISNQRSIVVVPSRRSVSSRYGENFAENEIILEETEIAAHVSVPHDGGWGWVVVTCSFISLTIMDGIVFTFGSLLSDIAKDLQEPEPMVALINSISMATYFIAAPLASALINRFGFRASAMSGSALSSVSFCCSYFSKSLLILCLFYGVCAGLGFSLINMAGNLVVGFYFERHRATAMAITTAGSGVGVLIFSVLNTHLVKLIGWRMTTLLHCVLLATIIFLATTYRPLVSVAVTNKTDEPTRTVTFLPAVSARQNRTATDPSQGVQLPTIAERIFGAYSNVNYPTSAAVVEETTTAGTVSAGPSTFESSLTLTAYGPQGSYQRVTIENVRSMTTRSRFKVESNNSGEVLQMKQPSGSKKKSCWKRIFHWEPHVDQSRPMYRDDAFYEGRVTKLPAYEKSMMGTADEERTGLEYQLAVSRAAGTDDLHERHGLCTTALRRVLATMLDPALLKRPSVMLICVSGLSTYLGVLVPYVFLQDRNRSMGVDPTHNALFISILGLTNSIGRVILGFLANKFNPTTMMWISLIVAGLVTTCSHLSFSVYYQYWYCCMFGFFIAGFICLRSAMIVSLYGLDKLTNATGVILLFQGVGSLFGTPLAGVIMVSFGYTASFVCSGLFIVLSGIMLIPAKYLANEENKKNPNG